LLQHLDVDNLLWLLGLLSQIYGILRENIIHSPSL
jgi:hypothetical protein